MTFSHRPTIQGPGLDPKTPTTTIQTTIGVAAGTWSQDWPPGVRRHLINMSRLAGWTDRQKTGWVTRKMEGEMGG